MTARRPHTLSGRVVLASLVLLPLFLGTSGIYLERSHRLSIEAAAAERLQLQILALLAQAEYETTLTLPGELIEARLEQPNSGLYAQVLDRRGDRLWLSPSAVAGLPPTPPANPDLAPGERHFSRDGGLFHLAYQVIWETTDGRDVPLRFEVLETTAAVDADLNLYRRHLLIWLGGAAGLLIVCQFLILRWALRPLRRLARDIAAVEAGERDDLDSAYPAEVQALTHNLNTLLHSEKQRRERARSTLADLAHSLKTPLAVIASANHDDPGFARLVQEQTRQMEDIVSYQLQRAVGGSHQLLRAVAIRPVAERLRRSLEKVYADRATRISLEIPSSASFRGDERDLLEMLGNLADNACKYGSGQVLIRTLPDATKTVIEVHDDGTGISPDLRQQVLQRGARADTSGDGHGIGLAVVNDIAGSYGGGMTLSDSHLGGACIRLELPA